MTHDGRFFIFRAPMLFPRMFLRIRIFRGRQYLYLERRVRVGKKVKSESYYIGPVGGGLRGALGLSKAAATVSRIKSMATPRTREEWEKAEALRKDFKSLDQKIAESRVRIAQSRS
jgi:hypothetical protein